MCKNPDGYSEREKRFIFLLLWEAVKISVLVKKGDSPIEEREGVLVVYSKEKRENNKANWDVMKQIAKFYSLPLAKIRLISGAHSIKKMMEIHKER